MNDDRLSFRTNEKVLLLVCFIIMIVCCVFKAALSIADSLSNAKRALFGNHKDIMSFAQELLESLTMPSLFDEVRDGDCGDKQRQSNENGESSSSLENIRTQKNDGSHGAVGALLSHPWVQDGIELFQDIVYAIQSSAAFQRLAQPERTDNDELLNRSNRSNQAAVIIEEDDGETSFT